MRKTRIIDTGRFALEGPRMRGALYDAGARKRTVSITLNADLHEKARVAGINLSRVAERALAEALRQRLAEQVEAEVRQDLEAYNRLVEEHGSFADLARRHYAEADATGAGTGADAPV